ncbi:uncharacterized protein LOC124436104 [Xenia sp. Carnegie-2017]|uniref:uncharacterized protein LOC124436104 n=1 Tax=Xenia sp. Carnegie-2017 TaxID=2897299 RepID=UPI001F034A26|nr:uncharacterized protein LOC124436104 [Xenia sp. Carnegie-2017]
MTKDGKDVNDLWFILEGNGSNRGSVLDAYCCCLGGRDGGCKHRRGIVLQVRSVNGFEDQDSHSSVKSCSVSTRETVLECDFARDMCGWHSLPIKSWSRVKNTIVNASDNFGWNLPNDFFYIFALSLHSEFPVKFLSPKFSPRRFCTLSFAYKMFGIPQANLTILVLEDDDIAKHTEWTMRDDQGGDFWRRGFLKLSKYPRLTGVIFQFILAAKSTWKHHISRGNVSIDDIQLVCEKRGRITTDAKVCVQRRIPSAGCLHPANLPNVKDIRSQGRSPHGALYANEKNFASVMFRFCPKNCIPGCLLEFKIVSSPTLF